jgi:hypothetical protein
MDIYGIDDHREVRSPSSYASQVPLRGGEEFEEHTQVDLPERVAHVHVRRWIHSNCDFLQGGNVARRSQLGHIHAPQERHPVSAREIGAPDNSEEPEAVEGWHLRRQRISGLVFALT